MKTDFEYPEYMYDRQDYILFQQFLSDNADILNNHKLVIFGAGIRGSIFGVFLTKFGFTNYEFSDNNQQKWGGLLGGHLIMSPAELAAQKSECVVLVSLESKELVQDIEIQLEGMGFTRKKDLFSLPSDIYDLYLDEFFKPIINHVLVLGDCRFTFVSVNDDNTKTLNDMIKDELIGASINSKVLSMHALCMRAQYYVIKSQFEMGNIPELIVLPVNYETYNGTTHLLSSSQHHELMHRIYEAMPNKDSEFSDYVALTKERTLNPPFIFSMDESQGLETVSDKKLRLFLKMSYMYKPDLESEGIVYLIKAMELARQYNVKMLTFVPPLNYMSGKEYWGERFISDYNNGIAVFKEIIEQNGGQFLDQSYLLTEKDFYSKYDKNEIANYEGRNQMSKSLLAYIKEFL